MRAERGSYKKYWKYVAWTQPVLSSEGTIGGDSFACLASNYYSGFPAFQVLDNNNSTAWVSATTNVNEWFEFYNSTPIIIKKITCVNSGWIVGNYRLQGSNDNSTWETLKEGTNSNDTTGASWDIDIPTNNSQFKYYKFIGLSIIKGQRVGMAEMVITAYTIEPGTVEDYDFYTEYKYALPMQVERSYWKYSTTGQTLETASDWSSVGSGNSYFGSDASVHSAYQGSYNDSFTFSEPQNAGEVTWKFYGDKQSNFRLSFYIYATMNGAESSVYSNGSMYQNGSDMHGWQTITFTVPADFTALRIYTTFSRTNSVYCFGGLGKYQMSNEKTIIVPGTSSDYDYYTDEEKYKAFGG